VRSGRVFQFVGACASNYSVKRTLACGSRRSLQALALMDEIEKAPKPPREWRWLVRLPVGVLLAFCAVAVGAFSSTLIFAPPSKNPFVARCVGALMVLLCIWVLSLAYRLITNRPNHGGLLSPFVLKLVALYMFTVPVFLIVTGRSSSWSLLQCLHAALSITGAIGLWLVAWWRKLSTLKA
jgi:hypothetical protein